MKLPTTAIPRALGGWIPRLAGLAVVVIAAFLLVWLAFVERGLATRADVLALLPGAEGYTTAFVPNQLYGPAIVGLFFVAMLVLRQVVRGCRLDLVLPVFLLSGIGLALLYRLSPEIALARGDAGLAGLARKHIVYMVLGVAVMIATAWWFDERKIKRLSSVRYVWVLLSVALIAVTGFAGVEINDRRLWLRVGPLQFQTVELVKVCLVLFLAGFLADVGPYVRSSRRILGLQIPEARYTGPFLVMASLALMPIFLQRDLGPTLLLFWLFLAMFYLGAGWPSFVLAGAAGFGGLAVAAYFAGWPSIVRTRVLMWLDPFGHPNSEGIVRALWAVAEGGWTGTGWGYGLAGDIPIVQSDFNFAALIEEVGFLGAVGILGTILWFLLICARIALAAPGRYTRLLAAGIALLFALQTALIVAGNLNLVPMTGITLPFVSYGGSSLLISFALVGILLRISTLPPRDGESTDDFGMTRRAHVLGRVVAGLYTVLVLALGYLTIVAGDRISRTPHRDRLLLARMDQSLAAGVVARDASGDVVVIDEERFAAIVPGSVSRGRLKRFLPYVHEDADGVLAFDPATIQVANPRLLTRGGKTRPGRIYDREGRTLADSVQGRLPGTWVRAYPYGAATFHAVGHRSHAYGTRFVERYLEPRISGTARRSFWRRLGDWTQAGRAGDDIFLTIDAELSAAALEALGGRRGAVVALDIPTGDILALVGYPSIDPGTARGLDWSRAEQAGRQGPLLNRAVAEVYPPGSTFKILLDAAWREAGEPAYERDCNGNNTDYRIRDFVRTGHGDGVDMHRALAVSCNVYFADLGPQLGDRLRVMAEGFGFNAPLDLLPDDAFDWDVALSRILVRRDDAAGYLPYDLPWYDANPKLLAQTAIGQNQVVATPLQVAWMAATIGRGGVPARPRILRGVRSGEDQPGGDAADRVPGAARAETLDRAVSRRTASRVLDDMREVMSTGTGRRLPKLLEFEGDYVLGTTEPGWTEVQLAGKSGTAQVGDQDGDGSPEPSHAWFVVLGPADDPQVAVVVLIEHGGGGSGAAGPAAVEVLARALGGAARE